MWPLFRQARYLGRYRQIAQVLGQHGFGYLVEQLGLLPLLSLPRRIVRHPAPDPISGPQRLRQVLIDLGPTFVKLGQMLSTRPDILPAAYIAELNQLQDAVPPFPAEIAVALIEAELGRPLDQLYRSFSQAPLAAGSLGQVHAATLHDGSEVVVKVQRPNIEQIVALDLAIVSEIAALAQERLDFARQYDVVDLAWEFGATLRGELDYRREGRNADRFRKHFAGSNIIHVPNIYWEYTSARVLTSERLFGVKINDIAGLEAAHMDRRQLARNSSTIILQEIFRDGFFHADPHPGNFFALPGEKIGVVDFGQAVSLDRETTNNLLVLLVMLTRNDTKGALRSMQRLGILHPRDMTEGLQRDMTRFMERLVDRPLEEMSARETFNELLMLIQRHRLRLPAPLALLLRSIVMMEGVGVQLDPQLDFFAIARPYALEAFAETLSPEVMARRALAQAQELGEIAAVLPRQITTVLEQLSAGELVLRSRNDDMRRMANALALAGTRLALAVVLLASVLGLGGLGVIMALGGVGGTPALIVGVLAALALVVTGLALLISIVRGGRE